MILLFFYIESSHMLSKNSINWGVRISRASLGKIKDDRLTSCNMLSLDIELPHSQIDQNVISKFTLKDGTILSQFSDSSGGDTWGWGTGAVGGGGSGIPEKMYLIFYDTFDNYQAYQLDVELPADTIQRLMTTQYRGITDNLEGSSPNIYNNFNIGFAPKGWVILFMEGAGIRKEIGSWQAQKITLSTEIMDELTYGAYSEYSTSKDENISIKCFKESHPELYRRLKTGEWSINSDWYKMMQTKFPWNLEVGGDSIKWTGEYYIEYANTDKYEILSDQIVQHKTELKPVPTKIKTWIISNKSNEKYYIEFHMFPIPKWLAHWYNPYYQDPNLTYFFKRFEYFYPNRSLLTNDISAKPEEFATLKIHLNDRGDMDKIYLQKGNQTLPIDGAYQYYISEVDPERGGYLPYLDGTDYYRTQPKMQDLSNSLFVDPD